MNQITKPPETGRLPIDALAITLNALIPDFNPIYGRIHDANDLINALDRVSWDHNYRNLDVSAAVAKLNALRAQHKPDIEMIDELLTKPATKAQVKSLAGVVPKIFGKTDVTHIDHWLAAVFLLLVSVPISAPVLATAIKELLGESKFMPAPSEFYEACIDARRGVQRLRSETRNRAYARRPRAAPKSTTNPAAKHKLGHATIECRVEEFTADEARLAEIDENLIRADLTPSERAVHHAERKKLYLKLHPETKRGAAGGEATAAKAGKASQRYLKFSVSFRN
jgi:hypothetical protein